MKLDLDPAAQDSGDAVVKIHQFLWPAICHIRFGGTVMIWYRGRRVGRAHTVQELYRLCIS